MQGQQETISASSALVAGWKSRVDDLATRLMIDGGSPDTVSELRVIGDQARQCHADRCAQVVDSLISKLEEDMQVGTRHLLNQGVAELRHSIEASVSSASTGLTASEPASLGEDAELVSDFLVEAREHLSQIEG